MPKLIKFEKNDCQPCNQVSRYLEQKSVHFEAVNAFDHPEQAAEFGIYSVPVTLLLDDENQEIGRTIGFKPQELDSLILKLN